MHIAKGLGLLMLGLVLVAAPVSAAAPKAAKAEAKPAAPAGPSLYQRLGEEPGTAHLVDVFVGKVAADKRINGRFKHTNIVHFKKRMTDLIVKLGGGPDRYGPVNMKEAHAGMGCTAGEFNAIVEDFVWAENKVGVDKWSQKQLGKALGGTRSSIVQVEKNTYPSMTAKASGKPAAKPASKKTTH